MDFCSDTLRRFLPIDDPQRNLELKAIVKSYEDDIIPAVESSLAAVNRWLQDLSYGVSSIPFHLVLNGAKKTISDVKQMLFPPDLSSGRLEETIRQLRLQTDRIIPGGHWHRSWEEEKVVNMIKEGQLLMGLEELNSIRWELKMLTVKIMAQCLKLEEHIEEEDEEEEVAVEEEMERCVKELKNKFDIYGCHFRSFAFRFKLIF